ncbi:MAG: glucose-6-phosphate isomerase [Myxococcota bacterium]
MEEVRVDLESAGIDPAELSSGRPLLQRALRELEASPRGGFLRVVDRPELLREIQRFCRGRRRELRDVVQLGIGGSSLGAQALCRALLPPQHNLEVRAPGLRFHLPDNVDPEPFSALLERLNPRRTLVHVVSKSGGTLETQAQLHALLEHFERRGSPLPSRNLVVTTGARGPLRSFAEREGIPVLEFPEDVPGRYSVFTASGLLVPALCGVPVGRVLAGARRMAQRCTRDGDAGPAGALAAVHHIQDQERRRPIHVELIYCDALLPCGEWFRQIWAESLGKGGRGPTPVTARGTTDQHSQIQLYMEGPDDKLYTVLRVERSRRGVRIGGAAPEAFARRDLSEVFAAEAEGTERALIERGRPVIRLRLARLDPGSVGAVLMLQQLQTALAGALYGVDPFTQPGVEAGKRAALEILRVSS